ncbi:MAG TPA: hypothetical protein VGM10_26815 [Actinocrinis sp.]|jgi:divalent metal cation (Fe/Co/Zn/Cd) transporter
MSMQLPLVGGPAAEREADCRCHGTCQASAEPAPRDAAWLRAARHARWLAWASLAWMCTEGAVGLWQGYSSGSISLIGWALGSAVEGLASVIVVWRFTGARTLSEGAERRAQQAVALSFWLLAPYIAVESVRDLLATHRPETSAIGMALTAIALLEMPLLGRTKHKLAITLDSKATAGEGTQNYLCAAQAAAVLVTLAATAIWPGGWWLDPAVGLAIAAVSLWAGIESWRGEDCGC